MIFGGIFTTMKESVKIDSKIVERIRTHIKLTGQTISGYINVTLDNDLKEREGRSCVSDYASNMAPTLTKAIKSKK